MDTISTIWIWVAIGVLGLGLHWIVHCGLQRWYLRLAHRFCQKRGLTISRSRCGPAFDDRGKTEYSIVELDCVHPQEGRQLIRLLVWVFGVREVLSIEPFPEEEQSSDETQESGQQPHGPLQMNPPLAGPFEGHAKRYAAQHLMRLPAEIPYNPRAMLFVLILALGALLWIGSFLSQIPPKVALLGSLIAGALVVVLGIRRLLFKRTLTLRENDMVIPTGFMQLWSTTVAYAQLSEFRAYPFSVPFFSRSLHVDSFTFRNGERTLQLSSILMPDDETYLEVCHFLAERAGRLD